LERTALRLHSLGVLGVIAFGVRVHEARSGVVDHIENGGKGFELSNLPSAELGPLAAKKIVY